MGSPQVLVRFKEGDHAYFDIEDESAYLNLKMQLEDTLKSWIRVGPFALVKKENLDRIFFFPDGYPVQQQQIVKPDEVISA